MRHLAPFLLLIACLVAASVAPATPANGEAGEERRFEVRMLDPEEEATLEPPRVVGRDGPFRVIGLEDRPALEDALLDVAFAARRRIRETTRVDWEGTAVLVWTDGREYARQTGHSAEFTSAAASARLHTIWINADAWRRASPTERQQVMTHELGHLLVGNLIQPKRLPLWAEEGIVMHLAGEWNWQRAAIVMQGHVAGRLPDLEDMEESFPRDPGRQALAYAYSYVAVQELARSLGDPPGEVRVVMARLSHPVEGPRLVDRLWNPVERDRLEVRARENLGTRVSSAVVLLSTGTSIWIMILILAGFAWVKRKQRRRAAARAERNEEPWLESLSEEDLQDVWGDREDRFQTEETPWERHERERDEREDDCGRY